MEPEGAHQLVFGHRVDMKLTLPSWRRNDVVPRQPSKTQAVVLTSDFKQNTGALCNLQNPLLKNVDSLFRLIYPTTEMPSPSAGTYQI